MMAPNPLNKQAKDGKAKTPRLPPNADYGDVVTDEHLARIRTLVPESEYKDAEVVSGPAW